MRRLVVIALFASLGCAANEGSISCGGESCEEAIPAVPAESESCTGSDWYDDGGGDDTLRTAPLQSPLVPADGEVLSADLFPAGDIDVYQWPIAMTAEPIELRVETLRGGVSALDLCVRITTPQATGSVARCVRGEERLLDDQIHCCAALDDPDRSVVVMPAGDPQSSGFLEAQVALAVGGHCDHYALEISAAE